MRLRPPLPHLSGLIREVHPYPLPAGLDDGTPVTVLENQGMMVRVRDRDGREWTLQHWLVDCGVEIMVDGRWLPEQTPAALDEIGRLLTEHGAMAPASGVAADHESSLNRLRDILRRNGR